MVKIFSANKECAVGVSGKQYNFKDNKCEVDDEHADAILAIEGFAVKAADVGVKESLVSKLKPKIALKPAAKPAPPKPKTTSSKTKPASSSKSKKKRKR